MGKIAINGMEFYAFHGHFKEEQDIGTWFYVDLEFETDTSNAEQTDQLDNTVNYQEVYLSIKKVMQQPSLLLEKVCRRIMDELKANYPEIYNVSVTVKKTNPPLGGKMNYVSLNIYSK